MEYIRFHEFAYYSYAKIMQIRLWKFGFYKKLLHLNASLCFDSVKAILVAKMRDVTLTYSYAFL